MKNLAMILGVLVMSFSAFAQEKTNVKQNELQGPAYKNYKHWLHKTEPIKVYSQANVEALQGPAYKNQQQSKVTNTEELVLVTTGKDKRQNLTGPAYKNYGPWSK
jgi:hypothetical protein